MVVEIHRIPGATSHEPSLLRIEGSAPISVRKLLEISNKPHNRNLLRDIFPNLTGLSESELCLINEKLLSKIGTAISDDARLYTEILIDLNRRHLSHLETLSFGAQILHTLEQFGTSDTQLLLPFIQELSSLIQMYHSGEKTCHLTLNKSERFILFRCLEASCLRPMASRTLTAILHDTKRNEAQIRKGLAAAILKRSRSIHDSSPEFTALKQAASTTYIMGYADSPVQPNRERYETSTTKKRTATLLIEKIIQDEETKVVQRLLAQDFQQLRQTCGLDLVTFDRLSNRLLDRATSEPWARAALLSIASASHQKCVTLSTRTNILGTLIASARRRGILTHEMEQEVLATSTHISNLYSEDHVRSDIEDEL
jgi:hypothetical protein